MKRILVFLTVGIISVQISFGQEMLPDFSVYKIGGNRVVVSWLHNYNDVKQLSVQRSYDKNNYFKTIGTMPDPAIKQNGFADVQAPTDSMYYRIFVMFEGGRFFTTKVKRPSVDSLGLAGAYSSGSSNANLQLSTNFLPAGFSPSRYIFTSPDRYVRVELPFDNKKYDIKFFSESNQPLFELKNVKERRFKLDRSYFYTSGYINFELFADGALVEKYKLFMPKEF